jgi:hypothetical protein
VPAYPTNGTAIEFLSLSLFVTVMFLKVRARTRYKVSIETQHSPAAASSFNS